jgi:type IV pilus assembly protein PilO
MQLSLTKLPWYAQIGAFVVLGVGSAGAFYYYYEMPQRADIESREAQLTALRKDIKTGVETANKLPEFRAQVDDLELRLNSLRAVLPEEKDAAELLRNLQNVAVQSNLKINSFRPGASVTQQLHAEWPISLELEGTYHNLALFFDRVGKFTRIVNITNLQVRGRETGGRSRTRLEAGNTLSATAVATTFVLLDKPAAPAAKPGARGRGASPAPAKKG